MRCGSVSDICVLFEAVYKALVIRYSRSMTSPHSDAYIVKMGFAASEAIDFDFLMSVPCSVLNPRSVYSVACVVRIIDSLNSIGIYTIRELLDKELGMLFVFLGELLSETDFFVAQEVIHIICGGPLLHMRLFRQLRLPQFIEYGTVLNREIYPLLLRALRQIDIVCVSSLEHLEKSYIFYRLAMPGHISLPPLAQEVLSAVIDMLQTNAVV